MTRNRRPLLVAALLLLLAAAPAVAQTASIEVDATEAPRGLLHAHLSLPASPGSLTLLYPKWIPGEHGPTGPVTDLVELKLTAGGKALPWRRDPLEMYAFQVTVPEGATAVEADLTYLAPVEGGRFTAGASATPELTVLSWNTVLLYPKGKSGDELTYAPSLRLPQGWKHASALTATGEAGGTVRFQPVSMTTLIDSPALLGAHLQSVRLPVRQGTPPHSIEIVADTAQALATSPGFAQDYANLVAEAHALFGAHHYTDYRWLLTLSDHVAHFGLEHHESSDNRMPEETLAEDYLRRDLAGLLAHEFVHSWNGKYRRPEGLLSPDYQRPMQGSMLWVYEGLTQFLGYLLPPRSGLWTPEQFRERLALLAANLDHRPGRAWRPLADTAVAAQLLFGAPGQWRSLRRGTDFYDEMVLVWLEADTILRRESGGKRSMDDFCRRFHGGESGPPKVVPYGFDDLVATLNEVAPHDWRAFLTERLESTNPRAPLAGLEASGWRLVYTDVPNQALEGREERNEARDWTFSLGIQVDKEGNVQDVVPGMPAERAGMTPGVKIVAVDGWSWDDKRLERAIARAKGSREPLEITAEQVEVLRTYRIDYHDGPRYPHLQRIEGRPDLLTRIIAPLRQGAGH